MIEISLKMFLLKNIWRCVDILRSFILYNSRSCVRMFSSKTITEMKCLLSEIHGKLLGVPWQITHFEFIKHLLRHFSYLNFRLIIPLVVTCIENKTKRLKSVLRLFHWECWHDSRIIIRVNCFIYHLRRSTTFQVFCPYYSLGSL